jgi:hypothetical protein
VISLALSACGAEAAPAVEPTTGPAILASEKLLTLGDLTAVGFKKGKTFDVAELENAESAYYGFYGSDPYNRAEYEARFYRTHADAVAFGVGPAEERTGKDAILKSDEAGWDEGLKEARACTRSAGGDSSNCRISRYGGYVIYGNLVLVCQGRDATESRNTCDELLARIP